MNRAFRDLDTVIKKKNIHVSYHRGYRVWKEKFDRAVKETKSVSKALDLIHGKQTKEEK